MAGKTVGILALQGAFREHERALQKCGAKARQVRTRDELEQVDALIIPGGESTAISRLMQTFQLDEEIIERNRQGMAIWGTCAGMILLAHEIVGIKQPTLGLMNTAVVRNGFGRQADSFEADLDIEGIGSGKGLFIRAPYVQKVWGQANILACFEEKIVMVEEGKLLATAFHPELTANLSIHDYFLQKI
ncbi:Glutamine amidotransferase subunit PdxT [Syntrophomonas zehnderi OL-4]|uniref:Pyridoxal 5'-phosphate synthase subunit PdxT n=1 Tax=Syntrophomonas zehnderi OL-4 TaxID=690567 RepID=A0A0E3W2V7_9FIRM|nr:pyridoxal 5'-phosphate synthase glutaminase subunit PdxT [Syntrophomonas zehnderi]CFX24372.1 Glutamine amidotransferase subunit PdxT [Syntrophomonas zehnderi OL-4]